MHGASAPNRPLRYAPPNGDLRGAGMRRFLALAVLAATILVACGGGGSKSSTTTAAAAAAAKAPGKVNFTGSFCGDGKTAVSNNAFAAAAGATEQSTLQKNLDLLKKFEAEAPSEIRGDVTTVLDFYSKFV